MELDLGQVEPNGPEELRGARWVRVLGVKGKGGTERNVLLSTDAREALADNLEEERPPDRHEQASPPLAEVTPTL